jgi:predicted nucleic acid-binding protein
VYLETSIVGHLTSRLSRDLVTAGHQELTQEWWETERRQFDLYISALVVDEAAGGQPDEAAKRLAALEGVRELDLNEECRRLARELLSRHAMPEEAATDALHVATAAVNGMNFLLTWNCAHMANAERRQAIEDTCRENGYEPPRICTPEELMGERPCQT